MRSGQIERLPKKDELESFIRILGSLRELSGSFVRDVALVLHA